VRRIVRAAALSSDDVVVEVGPGLGSLTLGLLPNVRRVVAVEVDPVLASALPETARGRVEGELEVVHADALRVTSLPARRRPRWSRTCRTNVAVP